MLIARSEAAVKGLPRSGRAKRALDGGESGGHGRPCGAIGDAPPKHGQHSVTNGSPAKAAAACERSALAGPLSSGPILLLVEGHSSLVTTDGPAERRPRARPHADAGAQRTDTTGGVPFGKFDTASDIDILARNESSITYGIARIGERTCLPHTERVTAQHALEDFRSKRRSATPDAVAALCRALGYEIRKGRGKGSHWLAVRAGAPAVTIPTGNKVLGLKTATRILKVLEEVFDDDESGER